MRRGPARVLFSLGPPLLLAACSGSAPPSLTVAGLHGRVVDERGQPVSGAAVSFLRPGPADFTATRLNPGSTQATFSYQTVTDARGHYHYPDPPEGTYSIFAQRGELSGALLGTKVTGGTSAQALAITLALPGALKGSATLQGAADNEGIDVFLAGTSFVARTDAQGQYAFTLVPKGTYRLVAQAPGYAKLSAAVTVSSLATTAVPALDLQKVNTTGRVSGRVSLEGMTDHSGVSVTVPGTMYAASTDAGGSFSLDLPAGTHTLRVSAPGYTTVTTNVTVTVGSSVVTGNLGLDRVHVPAPTVTGTWPSRAVRGSVLTVTGTNFGADRGSSVVTVGGADAAQYLSWSDTQIVVKMSAAVSLGTVDVTVGVGQVQSVPISLRLVTPAVRPIAAGTYHSAAIRTDGTVAAWGDNRFGRQTEVPPGLSNVVAVASQNDHSLALRSDGSVVGWGANAYGQSDIPADVTNVVAVADGLAHGLALRSDGSVRAWSSFNSDGQATVPGDLSEVVAIAAGEVHSLALQADGTVRAWGGDRLGQTDVPAELSRKVVAVAAGRLFNLALKRDGTVSAWGDNSLGQTDVPAELSDPRLAQVVAVAAGNVHALALKRDGTVRAWGDPRYGAATVPAELSDPALARVVAIAAGGYHNLALRSDGTLVAWGSAFDYGQTQVPPHLSVLLP